MAAASVNVSCLFRFNIIYIQINQRQIYTVNVWRKIAKALGNSITARLITIYMSMTKDVNALGDGERLQLCSVA